MTTTIQVGDIVPSLSTEAITRTTLALYAGASGDHNPIHIDSDFAKAAGMPDVFAHGMLSMAYLGRMLTDWAPQVKLKKFSARFLAMTQLQDVIECSGKVVELVEDNGETLAKVEIQSQTASGNVTIVGEALVAI